MEKYLRPETLFGTKFESYLNQNIVAGTSKQKPVNRAQSQLNSILDSIREDIENEQGGS